RCNQARSITIFARCRQQNAIKPPPYKILFFGSDHFALSTLEKLHNSGQRDLKIIKELEVVCLAHSNARNSVIYKYSQENDIPTHFWGSLPPLGYFDMGVIVSFGKMMPRKVIESFELGMINVHGSLLPALRG
uniref:Formyl transferase N-terminal domain-containing protein n=1 Tax=Ciona savignyi TaxID=51511 RepID=H2Y7Y5_CIOSA